MTDNSALSSQMPVYDAKLSDLIDRPTRNAIREQQSYEKSKVAAQEANDLSIFFQHNPLYQQSKQRYAVDCSVQSIAGVDTEIFTPSTGIPFEKKHSVLINLHGGGFYTGSRTASHMESLPIACLTKTQVVSIDYRMAPDYQFPSATDDVVSVYQELLTQYDVASIGIFGCSAGALLTAQVVARLIHERIPCPAAIIMSCGAAYYWLAGDSGRIMPYLDRVPFTPSAENPYLEGLDSLDATAFPGNDSKTLSHFPPSLLISSSLDFALSSVIHTHSQLSRLGVPASLHCWEGMRHAFLYNSNLAQSREAYQVMAEFFAQHLR